MQDPWRTIGLAAIAALGVSIFLAPICERTLPRSTARFVVWPASLWMGFAFLLTVALLGTEALFWIATQGGVAQAAEIADGTNLSGGVAAMRAWIAAGLAGLGSIAGLRSGLARTTGQPTV